MEWAYGDPGIGIILWQAACKCGQKEWIQNALRILRHAASRKDYREEKVYTSGLLNGTAGLAQVFSRIFYHTNENIFKEAAIHWLDVTTGMACKPDGLAGYKVWRCLGKKEEWVNDAGLIEGIAGIGLTLISTLYNIEPSWDDCLLIS
jgi:lantibiotic modifying enzyme